MHGFQAPHHTLLAALSLYGLSFAFGAVLPDAATASDPGGAKDDEAVEYLSRCEATLNQLPRLEVEISVEPPSTTSALPYLDIWEYGPSRQFYERRRPSETGQQNGKTAVTRFAVDYRSGMVASMTSDDLDGLQDIGRLWERNASYTAHIRPLGASLFDLQPPLYLLRVFEFDGVMMSPWQLSQAASAVRYVGTANVGGAECVQIEILPPPSTATSSCTKLTLHLDPQHGYLPRLAVKESVSRGAAVHFAEKEVLAFTRLRGGAFFPVDVKTRDRMGGAQRELSRFTVTRITPANGQPRSLENVFVPNQLVQLVEEPYDPKIGGGAFSSPVAVQVVDASGKLGRVLKDSDELRAYKRARAAGAVLRSRWTVTAVYSVLLALVAGGAVLIFRRRLATQG